MSLIQQRLADKKRALIVKFKNRQDTLKLEIQQMVIGCQQAHEQIMKENESIKQTTATIKKKAKQFINSCLGAVTEGLKSKDIIDLKELADYLNVEKQLLKGLVSKEDIKQSNSLDLHKILSQTKLESTLRKLKKIQLEQEIKFLQSNVIVKGTLIYNPAVSNPPSPAEQKEINSRLQNLIQELERVITLSIPCISHDHNEEKLQILHQQELRLKQCQEMLTAQENKITKFGKYFQQEFSVFMDNLPVVGCLKTNENIEEEESDIQYQKISQGELDQIIEFNPPTNLPANKLEHGFQELSEKIGQLCKKYKKMESMM